MKESIKKKLKSLPDSPGVYFFKKKDRILYIGKATSLRDRVRSYFNSGIGESRGPLISKMLSEFNGIAYQKTDSVLEALVLEAALIKKHQPEANVKDKDNRSFNYVVITKEDFPRVVVMRGRELQQLNEDNSPPFAALCPSLNLREGEGRVRIAKTFGPFPNGSQLREAMKIVRRMFPYRGEKCFPPSPSQGEGPGVRSRGRACFERQLGLCPGVCTGEISKEDYAKQIKKIVLFFEGNKKKLVRELKKEMRDFAKKREFEKAERVKRQLYAIYHIQDVSLIKAEPLVDLDKKAFRIESYDVAHLSETNRVGVMTAVEDGEAKKSDYRKFKIRTKEAGDIAALTEILSRRLDHPEWPFPDLIVVDGGKQQINAAEKVLKNNGFKIPMVSVVKNERHRPREILGMERWKEEKKKRLEKQILLANAESHRFAILFHRYRRRKFL